MFFDRNQSFRGRLAESYPDHWKSVTAWLEMLIWMWLCAEIQVYPDEMTLERLAIDSSEGNHLNSAPSSVVHVFLIDGLFVPNIVSFNTQQE